MALKKDQTLALGIAASLNAGIPPASQFGGVQDIATVVVCEGVQPGLGREGQVPENRDRVSIHFGLAAREMRNGSIAAKTIQRLSLDRLGS